MPAFSWLNRLLKPEADYDDYRRQGYVLRVLLIGSIALTATALLITVATILNGASASNGTPVSVLLGTLILFIGLYVASLRHYVAPASLIFVALYFLLATYAVYTYGNLFIQAWLLYVLVVTVSFILLGLRFGLFVSAVTCLAIAGLDALEAKNLITPDLSWMDDTLDDGLFTSLFLFMVIAVVAWLTSRQIERSFEQVLASEAALKKERDLLEVKVAERTRELHRAQAERMMQLYRFAAFGRLASGVFHDLANPLTTVSLSLEELKDNQRSSPDLQRAIDGTERMQRFITSVRRQLQHQEQRLDFNVTDQIKEAIEILDYKARKLNVSVEVMSKNGPRLHGNPIKFQQIITNLISNAIDAYSGTQRQEKRQVHITLTPTSDTLTLAVQDWGSGISKTDLPHIFEPFFTTKGADAGTGIGLSVTRELIERDFAGKITVASSKDTGTIFTVTIPLHQASHDRKRT